MAERAWCPHRSGGASHTLLWMRHRPGVAVVPTRARTMIVRGIGCLRLPIPLTITGGAARSLDADDVDVDLQPQLARHQLADAGDVEAQAERLPVDRAAGPHHHPAGAAACVAADLV